MTAREALNSAFVVIPEATRDAICEAFEKAEAFDWLAEHSSYVMLDDNKTRIGVDVVQVVMQAEKDSE